MTFEHVYARVSIAILLRTFFFFFFFLSTVREKAVAKIHESGVKVIKQFHQLKLYAAFQSPK